MILKEWQIWHTYSTYIEAPDLDLDTLAVDLVRESIVPIVVHQLGATYLKNDGKLTVGMIVEEDIAGSKKNY